MRQILVDAARARGAQKRGGGWRKLSLDRAEQALQNDPDAILDLHQALETIERDHPAAAALVKLRFFVGLTQEEAADALKLPRTTAELRWNLARARLFAALRAEEDAG